VALAGSLLHVWNHGLFKSLLFLGAGSVLHATGTREMSRLGGLWRAMPWTTACFALGAAAISGLPPLNGFVSEFLVYLALFDAAAARQGAVVIAAAGAVALALTGALALACFAKACGVVFLGAPRSAAAEHARECGPRMRGSMLLLASACVLIGMAPVPVWPWLAHAVIAWHPAWAGQVPASPLAGLGLAHPALAALALVAGAGLWRRSRRNAGGWSRALTWDCGFAAPTARMQYTTGSFAAILTEWFAWILRPERRGERPRGPFPRSARHEVHTPETVLDRLVRPAARGVLRVAGLARRLQHGRLPFYFLYLACGLLAVAWLVSRGARP
jgi:hydrogenase-4 component B